MAEQEQTPSPAGEPASSPGATGAAPSPAEQSAGDALSSAEAAVDKLKEAGETPPTEGEEADAAAALETAKETAATAASAQSAGAAGPAPVALPDLTKPPPSDPAPAKPDELQLLSDVNLHVKIELGRTRMLVEDVLRLGEGSVVELDKPAGDPVDVYVNERHVARGEVLVVNENFCVRISEIIDGVKPGDG